MTSASSVDEAGHSKPVLGDNPEGWGRRLGEGFRMGGHTVTPGWFMLRYGKNHHYIIK